MLPPAWAAAPMQATRFSFTNNPRLGGTLPERLPWLELTEL